MSEKKQKIIDKLLINSIFDGWNNKVLEKSGKDAGLAKDEVYVYFPNGISNAVDFLADKELERLEKEIRKQDFTQKRVPDKVTACILQYLNNNNERKESINRLMSYYSWPLNSLQGAKNLYKLTDKIWELAGDRSFDFSYYTKRGILFSILSSTILYWINSDDMEDVEGFIARRMQEVAFIPKIKSSIMKKFYFM